jgi:CHAT domain
MPKTASYFRSHEVVTLANGTRLRAPFAGTATLWDNDSLGFRAFRLPAQEDTIPVLRAALMEAGIIEQETVHLDVDVRTLPPTADTALRSPAASETVVLQPRRSQTPGVQVVLYVDEAGGMSWHLPDNLVTNRMATEKDDEVRSLGQTTFTIQTRTAPARRSTESGQTEMRGWITAIGRKVLKVLVLPVAAELLANPVEKIVAAIERKHAQNLIRPVSVDNYRQKITTPFEDWPSLAGKRALLIVHGIISSTDGMLSKLPPSAMQDIIRRYEGRVIASDHYTLSLDPDVNAAFFLNQLKQALPGKSAEFDILCHSRGGIVSRALVERGRKLVPDHNCSFRKVFFVATPNAGSPLGNPRHVIDMVDIFTNFLTKLPDGIANYVIEALLAIVKIVAYAVGSDLPGLAAMGTEGYIKTTLNANTDALHGVVYGAAAANYDPDPNDPHAFFAAALNAAVDRTFSENGKVFANDLVVPRDGVYDSNGNRLFPIYNPLVYGPTDHVYHNDFFAQERTVARINQFFEVTTRAALPTAIAPGPATAPLPPHQSPPPAPEPPDLTFDDFRGGYIRRRETIEETVRSTAAAAPPASDTPPTELKRDPQILFHERVTEGESLPLVVRLEELTKNDTSVEQGISLAFGAGQESVSVTVFLGAAGFDVVPSQASITVHRKRDATAESVTFMVTAHPTNQPIKRTIYATFFLDNTPIGAVTHYTYVVPKNYAGPEQAGQVVSDGFVVPPRPRQECDWTLAIVGNDPRYQIFLNSRIPNASFDFKDMGYLQLPVADLAEYLNSVLTNQFSAYPKRDGLSENDFQAKVSYWKTNFTATLEGLGAKLWQWLPEALRNEYFRLYKVGTPPRSILIHSDEMIFPWELIIPNDLASETKLKPLGIEHILGRWKPGLTVKPPNQMLKVHRLRVLNPAYAYPNTLKWAAEEAAELARLFPGIVLSVTPANLKGTLDLFKESGVQVLHFSGHGEVNPTNPDLNKILLENGEEFDALKLVGAKLCLSQPVIYMNACSVGNVGETVGRAGGFASNFVSNGCSGVIAPLWPINDRRSMEFAIALYRKLQLGRSIGEALQELRDENEMDPTYLAYTYFGDPWVRLGLPPPQESPVPGPPR